MLLTRKQGASHLHLRCRLSFLAAQHTDDRALLSCRPLPKLSLSVSLSPTRRDRRPKQQQNMRTVRVNLPLAVMLGLAGSSTAFLQSVRPTNFVVPAHKYNAAVSRTRAAAQPRPAAATGRGMRIMSAAVDETETTEAAAEATLEEAAEEIPVAAAVDDPISTAMEVRERERCGGGGQ